MRVVFLLTVTVANLLASHLVHGVPSLATNASPEHNHGDKTSGPTIFHRNDDVEWKKNVARGEKLLKGMKSDDTEAAKLWDRITVQSWLDGECKEEMKTWGYLDNTEKMEQDVDKQCSFVGSHEEDAFSELGITDRKSWKNGGPNRCFLIVHRDGPAVYKVGNPLFPKIPEKPEDQRYKVCATEYRVTNAEFTVGANPRSGTMFFISLKSPASQARKLWGRTPDPFELPAIESLSDVAWCFWNRALREPGGGNIKDIRHFMVQNVANSESQRTIKRALEMDVSEMLRLKWPGKEFSTDTEEGKALLGSPNGRAAGYFLLQHKDQLGGNKYIDKIRVFFPGLPWMILNVKGPSAAAADTVVMGNTTEEQQI